MKKQMGFGLVEVIAALGISTVVITSLVALSLYTLRSSLRGKLLLEGSKVANRELELVRAHRDSNTWSDFKDGLGSCNDSSYCHMDADSGLSIETGTDITPTKNNDGATELPNSITRGFLVESNEDNAVRIHVEVSWKDGADVKYSHLYTDLTNWQQR